MPKDMEMHLSHRVLTSPFPDLSPIEEFLTRPRRHIDSNKYNEKSDNSQSSCYSLKECEKRLLSAFILKR
jgi:hypothetical protein